MSTIRTPTGPLPKSVYWRRRLLLLVGVLAIVAVIVLIVVRPGAANGQRNGPPPAADRSSVTGGASPAASAGASAGPSGPCKASNVKVVAITDKAGYASGAQPLLSMSITNVGTSPCTYDVGTGAQGYVITSGTEKIWNSKDCQTGPTVDVQTLAPGQTLTTQPFAWDRTRSAPTTCSAARPPVIAGGASYHLRVTLGSSTSATTKQFLLN